MRRPGLQGWLVAAFVAVGMAASIAVALVVLPALESSVREERGREEGRALRDALQRLGAEPPELLGFGGEGQALDRFALRLRRELGAEVEASLRSPFSPVVLRRRYPSAPELLPDSPLPSGGGITASATNGRVSWATAPIVVGRRVVGSVEAASPVRSVPAELAIVRRRVVLAVVLVLGLAVLAGSALSILIGRRIGGLARTAKALAGGDLAARAPTPAPRELTTLGESLNGMAERLERLVDEIRGERDRDRAMVGSLAEGVIAVGPDGRVTIANDAARRLMGLPEGAEAVLDDLPAPIAEAVRAAEATGDDPPPQEVRLGDETHYEIDVSPLRVDGRSGGTVLTVRDVTAPRRLERARRDLVANVSHELRTPLTAIKGFLELLEDEGVDDRHRREFLTAMSQETARLERLVEEQMQLARLDAGALPLDPEPVDLGALAEEVVAPRRVLAERDGVTLRARPSPGRPVVAVADAARVEQVVLILLDNALRHTGPGGRVEVEVTAEGDEALVAVRDSGEGIPVDEQAFVFDRFYRGDRAREGRSAGLGLAIARGLAEAHGGRIELRSTPGDGSTFTLRLPLGSGGGSADPADGVRPPVAAR